MKLEKHLLKQNQTNFVEHRKQKQVTTGIIYNLGDLVYYKRKDSEKWKGPGKNTDNTIEKLRKMKK